MTKLRVKKGGGEDPEPLTPRKMKEWNMVVDFLKSEGYAGSLELDKDKSLGQALLNKLKKQDPSISITYDDVLTVQRDMQKLQQNMQEFETRKGNPNAKKIMGGISPPDGFLGSKTSLWKYPVMIEEVYHNTALQSKTNLGLMGGDGKPTGVKTTKLKLPPKGVKLEPLYDDKGKQTGMGYTDPETGDVIQHQ